MGTLMPARMHDTSMTEYLFVQWFDDNQIDTFKYEQQFIYDHEDALEFIKQFHWEDNCVYYWRELLQEMDDEAQSIHRMTDEQVEGRLAEMLADGQLKAYHLTQEKNDGDDSEYAEEVSGSEASKVAETDKRAIRKPEKKYEVHPEAKPPKAGGKTHKRLHKDGDTKDSYTKMDGGKPLGAKEGELPEKFEGLEKAPINHDELVKQGWPDLKYNNNETFDTFVDAKPVELKPGQKIYRIVDENAMNEGGFWSHELPANKSEWRSDYAVKDTWNDNGYYVEHVVGPDGLKAWEGKAAGQAYDAANGEVFYLEGGGNQLFITPFSITTSEPQLTNWPEG